MTSWPLSALLALPLALVILTDAFITRSVIVAPQREKLVTAAAHKKKRSKTADSPANLSSSTAKHRADMTTLETAVAATPQDSFESYEGGDYTVFVGR